MTYTIYESGLTGPEGVLIAMRAAKMGRAKSSGANVANFMTIRARARAELEVTSATETFISLAWNQFMGGLATNGSSRQHDTSYQFPDKGVSKHLITAVARWQTEHKGYPSVYLERATRVSTEKLLACLLH